MRRKNKILKTLNQIMTFVLVFTVSFMLLSVFELPLGVKFFNVMSGSMSPTIKTGSAIIVKKQKSFNKNDIVTFQASQSNNLTTHRIIKQFDYEGSPLYVTKGDANDSNDFGYISNQNIVGKVVFIIPYIGYLSSFVKSIWGLILFIFVPSLLIIYDETIKAINELRVMKAKRSISI